MIQLAVDSANPLAHSPLLERPAEADARNADRLLSQWSCDILPRRGQRIGFLRVVAAQLLTDIDLQCLIMLQGPRGRGKSSLMRLLIASFPGLSAELSWPELNDSNPEMTRAAGSISIDHDNSASIDYVLP